MAGKRNFGGNSSDFGRMTINQLLQEMDGFKSQSDVFVIGATNLKDSLDPGMVKITLKFRRNDFLCSKFEYLILRLLFRI